MKSRSKINRTKIHQNPINLIGVSYFKCLRWIMFRWKITDVQFNWGKIFANVKMNDWLCWLTFRHFFNWPLHNLYRTATLFVGGFRIWSVFFSLSFNDFHWFKIIGDRSKRHNLLLIVKINFWFALLCVCCARFYRHLFKKCIKCAITVYASNEGNKVIHLATYALMKW